MAASELAEFAPAKINLFLHVLGKRDDGYHELESLVVFPNIGDRLTAVLSDSWSLDVIGPFAEQLTKTPPEDNLVLKAAIRFSDFAVTLGRVEKPLAFTLEKRLPVASGIGGGSADAGAALRLCAQAAGLEIDEDLFALAAGLGADVPACVLGSSAWMSGIGDVVEPAHLPEVPFLVLVNPRIEVSTAEVFKRLDAGPVAREEMARPSFERADELAEFLSQTRNDLEAPAIKMVPEIKSTLAAIRDTGADIVRMSGSGATCFGLYESSDAAVAAANALRSKHPDWWVAAA